MNKKDIAKLRAELTRLDKVNDALFDRNVNELSALYLAEVKAVQTEAQGLIKELSALDVTASRLALVRRKILKRDRPLRSLWSSWDKWLDDIMANAEDYHQILGNSLGISKPLAQALKGVWPYGKNPNGIIGGLYNLDQASKEKVADIVTRSIIGSVPRKLSARSISEATGVSGSRGTQRLHDATMMFSRQVQVFGSRQYEFFLYTGPDDLVTRNFCHNHVDKIYSRDEIDRLRNNQIDDVFLSGGGYRCRHAWRPVKRSWYSQEDWDRLRGTT